MPCTRNSLFSGSMEDQWNFPADQRIKAAVSVEKQWNWCGCGNKDMSSLVSARFPSANATLHGGNRSRPDPVCNACRRLCSTLPTRSSNDRCSVGRCSPQGAGTPCTCGRRTDVGCRPGVIQARTRPTAMTRSQRRNQHSERLRGGAQAVVVARELDRLALVPNLVFEQLAENQWPVPERRRRRSGFDEQMSERH
jgi:hypothetical protein